MPELGEPILYVAVFAAALALVLFGPTSRGTWIERACDAMTGRGKPEREEEI